MRIWVCFSVLLLAVGCGGTGQSTNPTSRADQAADLAAALLTENISDPALLPLTGRAVYAGFATLDLAIGGTMQSYIGDLDLTVEFSGTGDPISGTLHSFDGLSGALSTANGNLDRGANTDVDYTFGADVDGMLTNNGGEYVIDASLSGGFRGRNQDGVTGVVFGDITGPNGVDIFDGTVAGIRTN